MIILKTAEELEQIAEELGLEHEDYDRLAEYVSLVGSYQKPEEEDEVIKDKLGKWIEWESETYYGTHESPADFVRYYYDNYGEYDIPSWVVVDWQRTWEANLRHDFYYSDTGHVWAEVY
jgi:hypothetical protein